MTTKMIRVYRDEARMLLANYARDLPLKIPGGGSVKMTEVLHLIPTEIDLPADFVTAARRAFSDRLDAQADVVPTKAPSAPVTRADLRDILAAVMEHARPAEPMPVTVVSMPERVTTGVVKRNRQGQIVEVTRVEQDAE